MVGDSVKAPTAATAAAPIVRAPAATVTGTLKRVQCANAATVPSAPQARALSTPCGPRGRSDSAEKLAASTPPTNAPISRMLGSAMRRLRVKNSARPQLATARTTPAA